jgi:hypothetical protein
LRKGDVERAPGIALGSNPTAADTISVWDVHGSSNYALGHGYSDELKLTKHKHTHRVDLL